MRDSRGDPASWTAADLGFHVAIAVGSRNPFLAALLTPLTRIMEESISASHGNPDAVMSGLAAHEAIWAAIDARDAQGASTAMLSHLDDSKDRLAGILTAGSAVTEGGQERPRSGKHDPTRPA